MKAMKDLEDMEHVALTGSRLRAQQQARTMVRRATGA
jgi:hypothetical protein